MYDPGGGKPKNSPVDVTPDFSDPPIKGKVDFGEDMEDRDWVEVRKQATNLSLGNTSMQLGFLVVEARMEKEELARKLKAAQSKIRLLDALIKGVHQTIEKVHGALGDWADK